MSTYDKSLGMVLVGSFLNTFLYGLVTYQFANYYQTRLSDQKYTRYVVFFLFLLDTFHSVLVIYTAWYYTVANFTNPAILTVAIWPYTFTPLGTALAALVTQLYLGFSIWRLTKSKIMYSVVIALAIPSCALGAFVTIGGLTVKLMANFRQFMSLALGWSFLQVVVDVYNTIVLIVLYTRLRTGFRKTDTMLNRLVRGAIQTGLFAGMFSIAILVSVLFSPDTNIYAMFCIPLGRIYTNTFLDVLLTRESIKAEITDENPTDDPLTTQIVVLGLEQPSLA